MTSPSPRMGHELHEGHETVFVPFVESVARASPAGGVAA